jgi:hypothetical protein
MIGTVRNSSKVDARGLYAQEWDPVEGAEVEGCSGRATTATAVVWKREDVLLHETTMTIDGEK